MTDAVKPWPALWALLIGFFMILVDTTIVAIANPSILREFGTDLTGVMWVTSAYLLAYAVPLLITGRLGDRFGPRRIYLIGLVVFTGASLACGFAGGIEVLIGARAVQGLGAALVTPQTMAVITRVFPPQGRGAAMGLWGAVAGVATLIGPILGGVLVDNVGWRWIFFINLPIGIVAIIAAWRLVPRLDTHTHRFDWLGVALSGTGMLLLVFGIQEGDAYGWGAIWGPITIWMLILAGIGLLALFVVWQHFNRAEPLLPLGLFRDRNFSLSNGAIFLVGIALTAMPVPLAFYFQVGRGLEPTQAALMLAPMAVISGILAPWIGGLGDRVNPKWISLTSFGIATIALAWYALLLGPETPLWLLLLPSALLGFAMSGIFAPLASAVARNLPRSQAGAGSGVYTMMRQVGSVLGSAAIAALLAARLAAELPGLSGDEAGGWTVAPPEYLEGFSAAMSQSLWLSAAAFAVCAVVVLFFEKPRVTVRWTEPQQADKAEVGR